ncbi:MAG: transposase [Desulfobacterales bacterium]|nr:transposase [Desulfobacterales bacterium]
MARAKRHFLQGYLWHITHRCHKKEFLLKLVKDRQRWLYWLFEAKKRYGLNVLNYIVTSNHIHLLVADDGASGAIPRSIQLLAGRTGQEYNQRKKRKGAFWQDRYHATAVQSDAHLIKCMNYIDLNMVRAGVVKHPEQWVHSGYNEIQKPKQRYGLIDFKCLIRYLPIQSQDELKEAHRNWIEDELEKSQLTRDSKWTSSIAVGDKSFVKQIKKQLGIRSKGRQIIEEDDDYQLRDRQAKYGAGIQNLHYWDLDIEPSIP